MRVDVACLLLRKEGKERKERKEAIGKATLMKGKTHQGE